MEKEHKIIIARVAAASVIAAVLHFIPAENRWLSILLYAVPYLIAGYDVIYEAFAGIFRGELLDEHFLMTAATIGAFFIEEYPEAVFVMVFYQVGELIGDIATDRSRDSVSSLMEIRPDHANVKTAEGFVSVSPDDVQKGDIIEIRPGEKIPLDAVVISGSSHINTSAVTGESLPRGVAPGDRIVSGCLNCEGVLQAEVSSVFRESTVMKILELVESAGERKSKAEGFITKFARVYTPSVFVISVLTAIIPPLLFAQDWSVWVYRALVFMVLSCPCALIISVPLAFFCGIGRASKLGVLVKGPVYLEELAHVRTAVFDKTGTLTHGSFKVTAVHPESIDERELLRLAASAEHYSTHPIALSLKEAYGKVIEGEKLSEVKEIAGQGVLAGFEGRTVAVGNAALMDSVGAEWHKCHRTGTTVHVALDGEYMGHIVISDIVKPGSAEAVRELRRGGIRTVMLTGDSAQTAGAVAAETGIDEFYAELFPEDKVKKVEEMLPEKKSGGALAFVGDGVNDAPVLCRADIGVAMGVLGSDAAVEAADVVLMDDDPVKFAKAIQISKKTRRIVTENVAFALGVKLLVFILGILGVAVMWEAAFADIGVTVLAALNAYRAYR